MAFVQRKNKKDKIVVEASSIDKSSDSETLRKSQKLKKRDDLKREVKTYNDMTIEVLNILESQGIDIYDPNRTGGMYQRREGVNELQEKNIIQSLIKDNKVSEGLVEDTQNIQNNNINDILSFFKKK
jgi:hypothetical protein